MTVWLPAQGGSSSFFCSPTCNLQRHGVRSGEYTRSEVRQMGGGERRLRNTRFVPHQKNPTATIGTRRDRPASGPSASVPASRIASRSDRSCFRSVTGTHESIAEFKRGHLHIGFRENAPLARALLGAIPPLLIRFEPRRIARQEDQRDFTILSVDQGLRLFAVVILGIIGTADLMNSLLPGIPLMTLHHTPPRSASYSRKRHGTPEAARMLSPFISWKWR